MGKREHDEKGQDDKNMFRHGTVENTWLICTIQRDITNVCGRHMRRQKWPDLCVNCRSAVNTVITHTYVHFFVDLKNVVAKCLAFTFLKRGENTLPESLWSLTVMADKQKWLWRCLEVDLSSPLNRVLHPPA